MADVDVIVVTYNSRDGIVGCLEPLTGVAGIRPIVVDNASPDGTAEVAAELGADVVALDDNRGFAAGCNTGWPRGTAPAVLFLNPDAQIAPDAVVRLTEVLERDERVGAVGPRIVDPDGTLEYSQRRFPRLRSTYARALFLYRLFPRAAWTDELVRDETAYVAAHPVEWLSGACLMVRRSLLEDLGGWDDGFFMYCEDKDLCRRIRDAGYEVRFEPAAVVTHQGGASGDRSGLLHVLAASRIRYARKHFTPAGAAFERAGVALGSLTRLVAARRGRAMRAGHVRALRTALRAEASGPRSAR